ncbi:MAG: S8 family serine peptidase [Ardenticatenales bacterium]|nr:S8 family serine peptidase [Ardenticatenales bacterium]
MAENRGEVIPNQYIVVMKNGISRAESKAQINDIVTKHGGRLVLSYESVLHGYVVQMPEETVFALQRNRNISFIEQDFMVTTADTQTGVTWGIDRTDQRSLPLDGSYTDYNEGVGVHAYIIDTGILLGHQEFAGRMGNGYDAVTVGGNANDCNGHGTHVAGTVGGTTYGIADKVTLHPVRVLACNGYGSNSGIIAGVDWVKNNHIKPAVANMSLGGTASSATDTAVTNAINAGVTFVVAAGNSNVDACGTSPARAPAAITVGSTMNTDARSLNSQWGSNWGTCLDIFAPGSDITSAWHTSTSAINTISGTSMASPHVAGAAALYLSANPGATAAQVRDALVSNGTTGKVTNAGTGSPNVLLYTGFLGTTNPTPTPTPIAGNKIVNGGFENGSTGWTQSSTAGYNLIDATRPRSGSYGVWGGGYDNGTDRIGQIVTVPANGTLTYYWQMTSNEGTIYAYDYMYVRVFNTSGTLLATLRTRSNTAPRNAWYSDSLSLAAYAGQTIEIRFAFKTDSAYPTSFFLDDITLQ